MDVAGVDWSKRGWLVVPVQVSDRLRIIRDPFIAAFDEIVNESSNWTAVGIDVPIGLSETTYWRRPDLAAKEVLAQRQSSVFAAPLRQILNCEDYSEACAISQRACGNMPSPYAFGLLANIREVDQMMTPELQQRVREVHPEVSFWALNGKRPLLGSKKSPAGALQRLELVRSVIDFELEQTPTASKILLDDFLDACAAAWTASRIASGTAERLPDEPDVDERGLRMEIVY